MQYPRIVGIALGWQAVVCPTCIVAQLGTVPLLEVEGRIRHDIVAGQAPVHILREGRSVALTQVVGDAPHSQVHLRQSVGGWILLLPVDIDLHDVALLLLDILSTLHKHPTRATARIVESAIERLNEGSDQLHNVMRRVELSLLLSGIHGKTLEEVFVNTPNEVAFRAEGLMRNLAHLVHHLFHYVGRKVNAREKPKAHTAPESISTFLQCLQGIIQCGIELRPWLFD